MCIIMKWSTLLSFKFRLRWHLLQTSDMSGVNIWAEKAHFNLPFCPPFIITIIIRLRGERDRDYPLNWMMAKTERWPKAIRRIQDVVMKLAHFSFYSSQCEWQIWTLTLVSSIASKICPESISPRRLVINIKFPEWRVGEIFAKQRLVNKCTRCSYPAEIMASLSALLYSLIFVYLDVLSLFF